MDTLLDTELGHQHIKGSIQDTDDSSLSHYRTILLGQVRNKYAEVQMSRLLLRKSSTLLLAVRVKISVSIQKMNEDSPYILHCWATFATASRSKVNFGSKSEKLINMESTCQISTHVLHQLGGWNQVDDVPAHQRNGESER